MTMTITFTGTAAELRAEMLVLLGLDRSEPVAQVEQLAGVVGSLTVDAQVEQAFGVEPKRSRGRPRKTETPPAEYVVEPVVEAEQPVVEEAPAPQPEVEEGTSFVAPEPEVVEPEQPDDTPANAQDLMTACMAKVAGDSAKKIALVKLLQSFDAKTVNGLAAENYKAFWAKVKEL